MFVSQRRSEMVQSGAAEMFRRVLAPWAMDIMRLRRAGLDRPTARKARRLLAIPSEQLESFVIIEPSLLDGTTARRLLKPRAVPNKLRRAA